MYIILHLSSVTSPTTPSDIRTVKTSSHSVSHKDNISLAFNITPCYSNQRTVLRLCPLIGSLIFISSQRWDEKHTGKPTFTHIRGSAHAHTHTHKPQREISWLLKYNYLTAGCHLGRSIDRYFSSLSLCLFLSSLCSWMFPPALFFYLFTNLNILSSSFNDLFDMIFHIDSL